MSNETKGIRFEINGVQVEIDKYSYYRENKEEIGMGLGISKSYSDMEGKSKGQFISQVIQDLKGVMNEFEQLLEKEDKEREEI